MKLREWMPLVGVVICVFIFNMSEFMPMGLLTDIADDFGVSESRVGFIISFYAWAVALLSLPLMLIFRNMEYKKLLILMVAMFTLFQGLSGLSNGYWMLMGTRVGVAMTHCVFWSIAAPLAVRVVPPKYEKVALSAVATGTSIAMILGLPLGRVIGLALGWRMTFVTICIVSVLALFLLLVFFPRLENPGTFTLNKLPMVLKNRVVVGVYVLLVLLVTGCYTTYSYIEPFLAQIAGFSDSLITVALTVFGIAGIGGSIIFARLSAGRRTIFMITPLAAIAVALLALRILSDSPAGVFAAVILWGGVMSIFNTVFQEEIILVTEQDSTPIAMSLFSGIYNAGIASGTLLGGFVTDTISIGNIGYVGSVFAVASLLFTIIFVLRWIRAFEAKTA
ncbi:MAG: MFS transporter [archaeon]|nr:MFS transporter [archaeon]